MEFAENIVKYFRETMGIWYFMLFNAIGSIGIVLQILVFQMKTRRKIIFVNIASNISWLCYFWLQADFVSGLANIIGIMSNIIFMMRGKYRWADSKLWLILFLVVGGAFALVTFKTWKDIFAILASILSITAFFMLKERNIRILSLFTYLMFVCNSVSKGYAVALIADITALMSVVIALIRFKKKREFF